MCLSKLFKKKKKKNLFSKSFDLDYGEAKSKNNKSFLASYIFFSDDDSNVNKRKQSNIKNNDMPKIEEKKIVNKIYRKKKKGIDDKNIVSNKKINNTLKKNDTIKDKTSNDVKEVSRESIEVLDVVSNKVNDKPVLNKNIRKKKKGIEDKNINLNSLPKKDVTIIENTDIKIKKNKGIESKDTINEKDTISKEEVKVNEVDNSLELLYIKHLRELIVNDINLCKEIDHDLDILNDKLNECYNESDLLEQKRKLEELYDMIKELYNKYYYVINNSVYKYLDTNNSFNEKKIDVNYLSKFKVDEKTEEKTKELFDFIEKLENVHNVLQTKNLEKEKELLNKKQNLSKIEIEKDLIENVNRLTEIMIANEKRILNDLINKVGKVSSVKQTKTKFVVDYDKLLTTPIVLSGLTAKMPFLATTKLGMFLGVLGISNSIKNINEIAYFEKYEVMKHSFVDYSSIINNNLDNVDSYLYIIKDSKVNLDELEKTLSTSYSKYNSEKYNSILFKIKTLKKELDKKEIALSNMKKSLNKSKEENKKGYSLYKKMKSENK